MFKKNNDDGVFDVNKKKFPVFGLCIVLIVAMLGGGIAYYVTRPADEEIKFTHETDDTGEIISARGGQTTNLYDTSDLGYVVINCDHQFTPEEGKAFYDQAMKKLGDKKGNFTNEEITYILGLYSLGYSFDGELSEDTKKNTINYIDKWSNAYRTIEKTGYADILHHFVIDLRKYGAKTEPVENLMANLGYYPQNIKYDSMFFATSQYIEDLQNKKTDLEYGAYLEKADLKKLSTIEIADENMQYEFFNNGTTFMFIDQLNHGCMKGNEITLDTPIEMHDFNGNTSECNKMVPLIVKNEDGYTNRIFVGMLNDNNEIVNIGSYNFSSFKLLW